MLPIDRVELSEALLLSVVKLHNVHSSDVLLEKRIDFRDSDANPPVGIADLAAEHFSTEHDQRNHG